MIIDLIKSPNFKNTALGRRAKFWYYRLFEMVASIFEYENLPQSINRDYLESVLLSEGSIVWIKDKEGKLRALRGSHYGFDCYNFPTSTEIANPVLGTLKGTFGINSVWMRNNIYAKPINEYVREYALEIAQLDVDFKVNLDNLKLAMVLSVDNEAQARQVKDLYTKILCGEPAVITGNDADLLSENNVNVFASDIQYLGTQLLADRRTIINDFLTIFGINNIVLEKKERLITGEVDTNNQELEINKMYWLRTRQDAIEEVNKMFGTDISVDIVKSADIEKYTEEGVGDIDDNR